MIPSYHSYTRLPEQENLVTRGIHNDNGVYDRMCAYEINNMMRAYYIFLYVDACLLNTEVFEFHHSIGCHILRDKRRVIFFNRDNGAVSEVLPALNGIESLHTCFDRF